MAPAWTRRRLQEVARAASQAIASRTVAASAPTASAKYGANVCGQKMCTAGPLLERDVMHDRGEQEGQRQQLDVAALEHRARGEHGDGDLAEQDGERP